MVELENRLGFVTELSETGAEAGHLLPTLVRNVDLIRVYFSEKQVHVHEGLVEFFLQHFKPPKHWHTRAETGALACRGASTRSGHVYRQRSPDVNVSLTSTLLVSDVNDSPLCEGTVEITLKRNDEIPSRLGGCKSSEFPFFFFFFFLVILVKSTTLPGSSSTETRIVSEATTTVWLATGKSSWKQSHRCSASSFSSSSFGFNDGLQAWLWRFVPPPTVPLYGAWSYMVLVYCTSCRTYEQKCNVFHFCFIILKILIKNYILILLL